MQSKMNGCLPDAEGTPGEEWAGKREEPAHSLGNSVRAPHGSCPERKRRSGWLAGSGFPDRPPGPREAAVLKARAQQAGAPGGLGRAGFPVMLQAPSPLAGLSMG